MTSAGRQGDGPAPCTLSPNYPCILCLLFAGCHMVAASAPQRRAACGAARNWNVGLLAVAEELSTGPG